MSSTIITPIRVALLSAALLLGAVVRASSAAGIAAALGVVKMIGVPAAIAAIFVALELIYRSSPNIDRPVGFFSLNRGVMFAIGLADILLLAVIVLGAPFLAIMTSGG